MPAWKVFFIALLGCLCLGLAFATLIVPMTMTTGGERWVSLAGLFAATVVMATLFILFLRRASTLMR